MDPQHDANEDEVRERRDLDEVDKVTGNAPTAVPRDTDPGGSSYAERDEREGGRA